VVIRNKQFALPKVVSWTIVDGLEWLGWFGWLVGLMVSSAAESLMIASFVQAMLLERSCSDVFSCGALEVQE
jgi:hypothetical protein